MGLIDELHNQHMDIKKLLKKIQINTDADIIDSNFKSLKIVLISHLINEDNYLYPALRSLEATKQISDSYEDEMSEISSEIMNFYTRYESGNKTESFNQDIEDVIDKLIYRITKEERELYPIFKTNFPNK